MLVMVTFPEWPRQADVPELHLRLLTPVPNMHSGGAKIKCQLH